MTGFQPIVVAAGTLEQVGTRRTEILKLNLGPPNVITTGAASIPFDRTVTRIIGSGQDITTITGGAVGDVAIVAGQNCRLRNNIGNLILASNFVLQGGRSIVLYFTGTNWVELNRSVL